MLAGTILRIEIKPYENVTDKPVRIRLVTSTSDRQWRIEPGEKLGRVVIKRKLPPSGKVKAVLYQYDRDSERWVRNENRTCSPPVATIAPYFAKCKSISNKWYHNKTNRTLIKHMGICLTKYFPRLTVAQVNHVATCESHWSQNSSTGKYKGVFQLGDAEFKAFSHQGPSWMHAEFVRNAWFSSYNIFNARANILAALAHANRYGWKAWSCAP